MAIYCLPEGFVNEHGSFSGRWLCVWIKDGALVRFKSEMVRERSRGRHDPGDGPYENRMAFGGETIVDVPGDSDEYLLRGSNFVTRVQDELYPHHARIYEDWSNNTYVQLIVTDHTQNGWGYSLIVHSYERVAFRTVQRNEYTAGAWGFTESVAEAIGLQLFNQYKGADFSSISDEYAMRISLSDPIAGAVVEREPKLSNQFVGPLDTLDADYVNRRIDTGLASAFVDACDKLPSTTGINNIANIADVISSFKSMSRGLTKVGSAADAWLSYRYSYSTTKSDIIALSEFANRLAALPSIIHSNGYHKDGEWEYRVSINVTSPYLSSLVSLGEKWGVALDAVNAWDLIPYSFIVDWFIPVSDLLERWQSQSFAMQIQQASWCSVRHEYVNEFGFKEVDYSRFLYEPQARFAAVSRTAYGPKASTIVKRALDVLALFA